LKFARNTASIYKCSRDFFKNSTQKTCAVGHNIKNITKDVSSSCTKLGATQGQVDDQENSKCIHLENHPQLQEYKFMALEFKK